MAQTGTFARVWLARLRGHEGGNDKLYALKVLRKAEGVPLSLSPWDNRLLTNNTVIKLKQVDHVNHEREILADVAGHPFITTLVATFSDYDSLYMLVGFPNLTPLPCHQIVS